MSEPAHALTLQLLEWISGAPRTYADVMERWKSTCPHLSIWEDALLDGLVAFEGDARQTVTLTERGRAALGATDMQSDS